MSQLNNDIFLDILKNSEPSGKLLAPLGGDCARLQPSVRKLVTFGGVLVTTIITK